MDNRINVQLAAMSSEYSKGGGIMATAFGTILNEGHWAEGALVSLLNSYGAQAVASTPQEDHKAKVDLWCRRNPVECWIPIQLSTYRAAIAGAKGMDALR